MKRAGDLLAAFFDEELLKKAKNYSGLFSSWGQITEKAGIAAAAGHSRFKKFERGVLLVEADHPGWIQILQTKEQRLLKDAQRRFPDLGIRGMSFMLSKPTAQPEPESPEPAEKEAEAESGADEKNPAASSGESAWKRIADDDFKNSLKQLEQSIRKREKPAKR
jgi:hypothetical protein